MHFLNWTTTKENIDKSKKAQFMLDKLNFLEQFVELNKQLMCILEALKTNLRSVGWEVKGATFLGIECRTRCITGLDLQGQVGISNTQKPAPKELSRLDVLLGEKSEGLKIVGCNATGTYRLTTVFYGLADRLAEFQKAMNRTINLQKTLSVFWKIISLCQTIEKQNMQN